MKMPISIPRGTEGIPRFQPLATALGAATAQQIFDDLRKPLEGVDLKAEAPKKRARKKSSEVTNRLNRLT